MVMETILAGFGEMGPTIAIVFVAGGLTFGLFGWRMIRYLVVIDAFLVALLLGAAVERLGGIGTQVQFVQALTLAMAVALPWLAWRYHRGALATLGGAVWFFLPMCMLVGTGVPVIVRVLLGAVGCVLAMAMHVTVRREAAVVTSGLQGGWFCLAALIIVSTDARSFGRGFLDTMNDHTMLMPLVGVVFSAILIAMQWADMERGLQPSGNA